MIITCDAYCSMGYIYLQVPRKEISDYQSKKDSKITDYVDTSCLHIPYEVDLNKDILLNNMTLSEHTYQSAVRNQWIDEEYCNDLDDEGYMVGIELSLPKDKFVDYVKNGAYRLYQTKWKERLYHVATFDFHDKVFDSQHVIYPLSHKQDAYVIVENTGRYNVVWIKALLTARDDLYPLDYLCDPQFILSE
ncbi:hypothetical protein [Brevibacillus reuszeri]|uniref:hypothetical protein n=1 Tax=Brevibacillus reuszeri TaxID=54915 RepID=UPI00289E3893|nr:hypothetical protein [Brevibacillus reuszeri]